VYQQSAAVLESSEIAAITVRTSALVDGVGGLAASAALTIL
jgi:hypothetical protein